MPPLLLTIHPYLLDLSRKRNLAIFTVALRISLSNKSLVSFADLTDPAPVIRLTVKHRQIQKRSICGSSLRPGLLIQAPVSTFSTDGSLSDMHIRTRR